MSKYLDRKCPNCRAQCLFMRADGNLECAFCRERWKQGAKKLVRLAINWVSGCANIPVAKAKGAR